VLGDGDLVPLPGGRKGWNVPVWAWALGAGVLAAALLFAALRFRRSA
jgi:hypothetical protein